MSLPRALSKLGFCSRSQAMVLIREGRVRIGNVVELDPNRRVDLRAARISVDGEPVAASEKVYLMLNKPRGLVTTRSDEKGRPTIYQCLEGSDWPHISPVGRLDQASEGLLLLTNDTRWAEQIASPANAVPKVYHAQVDAIPDPRVLEALRAGVRTPEGESLKAEAISILRQGTRNCWLEIVLAEGKNREIRRLLNHHGLNVLRLIRIAIGPLQLGSLPKGQFRELTSQEVESLRPV